MFSNSSQKLSLLNRLKYSLYKFNISERNFFKLILNGSLPRPHYALGLFLSASLASQLNYKKISIIEFGCWECEGLIDLEHYTNDIEKIFDIKIEIYGFEGGEGLPAPKNYKDRVYQFTEGEMKISNRSFVKNLKRSQVIYGDFKKTVPEFLKRKILHR